MLALIIGLCLLWIVLGVVGLLVKTLTWLALAAAILCMLTIAGGAIHAIVKK